MNLYSDVSGRMEYIQRLFLHIGTEIAAINDIQELIRYLDAEPPEFRSIAYESASFEIGLRDLKQNKRLDRWVVFREVCATQHSFHIDIGLGWAFAKTELSPDSFISSMQNAVKWMIFDGIGYYHALFKGRTTLKARLTPGEITGENLDGFDQGVGRRLWYMAKGNVTDVTALVQGFSEERHSNLYRGIGIACGYVGGNSKDNLEHLLENSGPFYKQLQTGIVLAAISRIASNTINKDIDTACRVICNKRLAEIRKVVTKAAINFFYLYKTGTGDFWLTQLESELLQTT